MIFFRICRKLQNYMSSAEAYMSSGRDDEEMEHDIKEFMNIILSEEDEQEYTDYRRYFSYDMEIVSRQGDQEIVANLSKSRVPPATARNRRLTLSFLLPVFSSATRRTAAAPAWPSLTRPFRLFPESVSSRW